MKIEISPGYDAVADRQRRDRFGGQGYLGGSLPVGDDDGRAKVLNVPSQVQIMVLEPVSCVVVARALSEADGSWRVNYLDTAQRFTVIGADWEMGVNSAIQDWIQPHPMDE